MPQIDRIDQDAPDRRREREFHSYACSEKIVKLKIRDQRCESWKTGQYRKHEGKCVRNSCQLDAQPYYDLELCSLLVPVQGSV